LPAGIHYAAGRPEQVDVLALPNMSQFPIGMKSCLDSVLAAMRWFHECLTPNHYPLVYFKLF